MFSLISYPVLRFGFLLVLRSSTTELFSLNESATVGHGNNIPTELSTGQFVLLKIKEIMLVV